VVVYSKPASVVRLNKPTTKLEEKKRGKTEKFEKNTEKNIENH